MIDANLPDLRSGSVSSGRRPPGLRAPLLSVWSSQFFSNGSNGPIPMFTVILDGEGSLQDSEACHCLHSEGAYFSKTVVDSTTDLMGQSEIGNKCKRDCDALPDMIPLGEDRFAALVEMPGGTSLCLAHPELDRGDGFGGRSPLKEEPGSGWTEATGGPGDVYVSVVSLQLASLRSDSRQDLQSRDSHLETHRPAPSLLPVTVPGAMIASAIM